MLQGRGSEQSSPSANGQEDGSRPYTAFAQSLQDLALEFTGHCEFLFCNPFTLLHSLSLGMTASKEVAKSASKAGRLTGLCDVEAS